MRRDDDLAAARVFGAVLGKATNTALGALAFWYAWNHFTDPEHGLRFSYVLVTYVAASVPFWLLAGLLWLVAPRGR